MSREEIVDHWFKSAQDDKKAATDLFTGGHYHWCLFLWHLALEKLFKAILTKKDKEIPFTHNLLLLAKSAEIYVSSQEEKELQEITTFNLEARYDDYKRSFYKKSTREYTLKWIEICQHWFENKLTLL